MSSAWVNGWMIIAAYAADLGDRLANVAAYDLDPDNLRPADQFGAERPCERGAERLGEKPLGVLLRLPEGDVPELAIVGGSEIARLEAVGWLTQLGAYLVELLDRLKRRDG